MNLKNENVPLARIGRDGKSIRCGACVITDATGARRHTCPEKLGERWFEEQADDDAGTFWCGYGFYLPAKFGLDPNGLFYRVTKRPQYRTEGVTFVFLTGRGAGKRIAAPSHPIKQIGRQSTDWGEAGEFVLPVQVLCPDCKKLNLITESLIESEPKKMAA
jgi:hypothetical protein